MPYNCHEQNNKLFQIDQYIDLYTLYSSRTTRRLSQVKLLSTFFKNSATVRSGALITPRPMKLKVYMISKIACYKYSHCGRAPDRLFEDHYVVFLMDKPARRFHVQLPNKPICTASFVLYLHSVGAG